MVFNTGKPANSRKSNSLAWAASAAAVLAAGVLGAGALSPPPASAASYRSLLPEPEHYYLYKTEKVPLRAATDLAVLQFDSGIGFSEFKKLASGKMKEAGLDAVRINPFERQVVARVSPSEAKALVASKTAGLQDVRSVDTAFYTNGGNTLQHLVTVPRRLIVIFQDGVGMDQRNAFFAAHGLKVKSKLFTNAFSVYASDRDSEQILALSRDLMKSDGDLVKWVDPVLAAPLKLQSSTALRAGDDPLFPLQWHLMNTKENTQRRRGVMDEDVDAPRAWNPNIRVSDPDDPCPSPNPDDCPTTDATTLFANFGAQLPVIVAVLDDGTDLDHEDYNVRLYFNPNEPNPDNLIPVEENDHYWVGGNIDDPRSDSMIDPRLGFDFAENDGLPDSGTIPGGVDGHGTAVAGLIAAVENNGVGVTGVAPGAKILTYRVFSDGLSASFDDFISAVTTATNAQADVGNHSYGGPSPLLSFELAFEFSRTSGRFNLGMSNFVSSANDYGPMAYPALYEATYSVGAVTDQGERVSYASFSGKLDFVGPSYDFNSPPGLFLNPFNDSLRNVTQPPTDPFYFQDRDLSGIVTTDIEGGPGYSQPNPFDLIDPQGNYTDAFGDSAFNDPPQDIPFSGTSASCPIITGVAALYLSANPSISSADLFKVLVKSADRPPNPYIYIDNTGGLAPEPKLPPEPEEEEGARKGAFPPEGTIILGNPNGWREGLGQVRNYSPDGFHHEYGYGRPNPYNAITNQFAPSPLRIIQLVSLYVSDFAADYEAISLECAPPGAEDPEFPESSNCGADTGPWVRASVDFGDPAARNDDEFPFLRPDEVPRYVDTTTLFPDLTEVSSLGAQDPFLNFEFGGAVSDGIIIMSNPPTTDTAASERNYNPRGRFFPNYRYVLSSATPFDLPEELRRSRTPMIMEIDIKHELGFFNVTDSVTEADGTTGLFYEFDYIEILAERFTTETVLNGETEEERRFNEDGNAASSIDSLGLSGRRVGLIVGDSRNEPKDSPAFAVSTEEDEDEIPVATWGEEVVYDPILEPGEFEFRTYRFYLGEATGDSVGVAVALQTGPSYLPEYDYTGEFPFDQVLEVRRDYQGFQISGIRIYAASEETNENFINPPAVKLVDQFGRQPALAANGKEAFFVDNDLTRVKTAYNDGYGQSAESEDFIRIERRRPAQIFQVNDPEVVSFEATTDNNLLMYAVRPSPTEGQIYLVTNDGYGEQLVARVPLSGESAHFAATLATASDSVLYTDGTSIYSVEYDGSNREFVVDVEGANRTLVGSSPLTAIREMTVDSTDSVVVFSAVDTLGDINLYAVPRIGSQPGQTVVPVVNLLSDSTLTNEIHPRFSSDGERLVFASNRADVTDPSALPTSPTLGVFSEYQIYVIENAVTSYLSRTPPVGQKLTLTRDNRGPVLAYEGALATRTSGPDQYAGGIYPAWGPDSDSVIFTGFATSVTEAASAASGGTVGEIGILNDIPVGRTTFPVVIPTPTPTPVPTTPPNPTTPPPPLEDRVSRQTRYLFDSEGDGWEFSAVQGLIPPNHQTLVSSLRLTSPGANQNVFGFYKSPDSALQLFAFDQEENPSPLPGDVDLRQGPVYLYRGYVSYEGTSLEDAPRMRLRMNSRDFQEFGTGEIVSTSEGNALDGADGIVDFLIEPQIGIYDLKREDQIYTLAFDLLNFGDGEATGGYNLERVDIFRIPQETISVVADLPDFTFDDGSGTDAWESGGSPGNFDLPLFDVTSFSLSTRTTLPGNSFGFWNTKPGTLTVPAASADEPRFVRFRTVITSQERDPLDNPTMRFRLSTADNTHTVSYGIVPIGEANLSSSIEEDKAYTIYMRVPTAQTEGEQVGVTAAWDVYSLGTPSESRPDAAFLHLQFAEFDLIGILGYPDESEIE
ncbi:MAG: S8 family serine peptidase [Sumerlaeia bacterium]